MAGSRAASVESAVGGGDLFEVGGEGRVGGGRVFVFVVVVAVGTRAVTLLGGEEGVVFWLGGAPAEAAEES